MLTISDMPLPPRHSFVSVSSAGEKEKMAAFNIDWFPEFMGTSQEQEFLSSLWSFCCNAYEVNEITNLGDFIRYDN
jgi:hypothetical protein